MKANRKVTVKDIAQKCSVSKALAAAVLSNSKNNIGCSDAKREKILKVAQKMNYRPNRLARAMSTGIVPLVAVCVNHINFQDDEINLYLHDLLPSMTFALKRYGFNTIFVPYDGVKELMEQVGSLADDNLIGGIITNFPPEHQSQVVNYLKKHQRFSSNTRLTDGFGNCLTNKLQTQWYVGKRLFFKTGAGGYQTSHYDG